MTRLNERIATALPVGEAFEYLADFANSVEWDPGVASAERIGTGEVTSGSRFRIGVRQGSRVVPMEYRIIHYHAPRQVVLVGEGPRISAVDELLFESTPDGGSVVDYTADIRLHGVLRLAQPFLGGTFRRIAEDASDGIRRTLTAHAAASARR